MWARGGHGLVLSRLLGEYAEGVVVVGVNDKLLPVVGAEVDLVRLVGVKIPDLHLQKSIFEGVAVRVVNAAAAVVLMWML